MVILLAHFKTVCLLNQIFIILLYMSFYKKCTVAFTIPIFGQISEIFMISSGRIVLRMDNICDKNKLLLPTRPNWCVCACVMVYKCEQ